MNIGHGDWDIVLFVSIILSNPIVVCWLMNIGHGVLFILNLLYILFTV